MWLAFKLYDRLHNSPKDRHGWFVQLSNDFTELAKRLDSLEWKKRDELSYLEPAPTIHDPARNESIGREGSHVSQDPTIHDPARNESIGRDGSHVSQDGQCYELKGQTREITCEDEDSGGRAEQDEEKRTRIRVINLQEV